MNTQEILEYNKRCLKVLGGKCLSPKTKHTYFDFGKDWSNKYPFLFQQKIHSNMLKFHSDWNWIMALIEAIERLEQDEFGLSRFITTSSNRQGHYFEINPRSLIYVLDSTMTKR